MAVSYQIKLSTRAKRAARFIRGVHREMQTAFSKASEKGLTQQALADKLEVNRATVNRRLLGQENLTLRTIADLAWALDYEPQIKFVPLASRPLHSNIEPRSDVVYRTSITTGSTQTGTSGVLSKVSPVRANMTLEAVE